MNLDERVAAARDMICRDGMTVITVTSMVNGDPSAPRPASYAYSIGMWPVIGFELTVVGLSTPLANTVIRRAFTALRSADHRAVILDKQPLWITEIDGSPVVDRFPLRVLDVVGNGHMPLARGVYDSALIDEADLIPCYQVCWPDVHGVFPDEDGCSPSARARQRHPLIDALWTLRV